MSNTAIYNIFEEVKHSFPLNPLLPPACKTKLDIKGRINEDIPVTDKQDFGVLHDKHIFSSAGHNRLWPPAPNRKGVDGFVFEGIGSRSLLHYCLFPADIQCQMAWCCLPLPYKPSNGVNFSQAKKREVPELNYFGLVE